MMRAGLALVLAAGLAQTSEPIDPSERPTGFVTNCTESGCHSEVTSAEWVHGPTAAGACTSCHKYDDEARHTFRLVGEGDDRQMCNFCHVGAAAGGLPHVHNPVENGQCLVCHDPHGSTTRALQRAADVRSQCLECHGGVLYEGKHLHSPVEDACTTCHQAHSSLHAGLLTKPKNELCMGCHEHVMNESLAAALLSAGGGISGPRALLGTDLSRIHPPQVQGCDTCHATHASDHNSLLREEPAQVCGDCHSEMLKQAMEAKVPHSVVTEGRACGNCHAPHGSMIGGLLAGHPTEFCLDCHAEPIQRPDGTTVGEVHDMDDAKYKHGAVQLGRCRGCHEVHGSDHHSLLVHRYTPSFYHEFDPDAYSLCFECHDSALTLTQTTDAATGFRNGSRNLHYVHVVASGNQGRTCRACHATHTSDWPKLMQESVPYGEWEIPIRFELTETGGSCAAGCHRAKSYDRVNPVQEPVR